MSNGNFTYVWDPAEGMLKTCVDSITIWVEQYDGVRLDEQFVATDDLDGLGVTEYGYSPDDAVKKVIRKLGKK